MLKKILQLIVVLLIATQGVMAQTVRIDSVVRAPGAISVQVDMLNYTDVAAITLYIDFDANLMDFTGIDSTQLTGGWLANASNGQIIVTYTASPTGTGYAINGKAFDLLFNYKGGFSSDLTFDTVNCEIAGSNLASIPSTYENGFVTQSSAVGSVSLSNLVDTVGNTVSMPINMVGAGFDSVSAITFEISFDATMLTYSGIIEDTLTGVTATANGGTVELNWTGSPMNFTALSHLLDIQFVYNGGFAGVSFTPGCEITDNNLNILAVDYTDGEITPDTFSASLTIGTMGVAPDSTFTVVNLPVVANGFDTTQLGAITLNINYDNSDMVYTGYTAQQLPSGWVVSANSNGDISMQWSNTAGGTLADDTLVTLNFYVDTINGQADVAFQPGTILKTVDLVNVPVSLTDGYLGNYSATFTVVDDNGLPVTDAIITFDGTTYPAGVYVFRGLIDGTYAYSVAKVGFVTDNGTVTVSGADVTEAVVLHTSYTVGGQLTYMGDAARPIATAGTSTTTVFLKNSADSTVAYTTNTDANGNYTFNDVITGSYFLDAATTIDATNSYDATDALIIYYVPGTLSGLQALAADVNEDNSVDVTDALIVHFSVHSSGNVKVSSWTAPDWIFEHPTITVSGTVTQDFSGICSGDANGDFVPVP